MFCTRAAKRVVKVASVQMDVVYGDVNATVSNVCEWIDKAAKERVDVVLFPELILSAAYSKGERFYEIAEKIPGSSTKKVGEKAREHSIYVIVGIAERGKLGVLYDSAVLFGRSGDILGVYRKTHIYPPTEHVFGVGIELPVFKTDFGTIGILVCYDLEFPETARVLALQGAEIIFHLVADWPQGVPGPPERLFETSFLARALENRTPLVISNRVGYDPDLKSGFYGLSRIVGTLGEVIVSAGNEEEMITATMDLEKVRKERVKYNYFRDRKPHLYGILCKTVS